LATLHEFDFEIRYIKGKENRVVDALSRRVWVNHIATEFIWDRLARANLVGRRTG